MGMKKGTARKPAPARPAAPARKPEKDYVLNIRFDPEERAQLEALERDMRLPRSVLVRQLILAEHRRRALS